LLFRPVNWWVGEVNPAERSGLESHSLASMTTGEGGPGTIRVGEWDATLIELTRYRAQLPSPLFAPAAEVAGSVELALNVMLLRGLGRVLLVDPGVGLIADWFPQMGEITHVDQALGRYGVGRNDIGLVVSTHLDPDHAGGLVDGVWSGDLRPAFPRARVIGLEPEVRRYLERDPAAPRNAGTPVVAALERAGVLDVLVDGGEVAPGVRVQLAAGHSPGHGVVHVAGDPGLTFVTDTVHTTFHVAHPEWGNADQDIPLALATRRRLLGELAVSGGLAWAAHIPGPAAARVERVGDGFAWRLAQ
jgi:glyoxylase-like metal-dependent hydrolase (beta-lactamase superfamily II)